MERKRIFIAEKYNLIRAGIKALLSSEYEIIGEASNGLEVIEKVKKFKPDLLITNLFLPKVNGIEIIEELKKDSPQIRVIILSTEVKEEYIIESFKAGAMAYISKNISEKDFFTCLSNVLDNKHYICTEISEKIIGLLMKNQYGTNSKPVGLTLREREILKLIAEGHTSKEIADYLFLSVKTVQTHRVNLMKKLDIHNISELTAFALNIRIIDKTTFKVS
jgi:DNA-binding NarL/FixJ family response regulator